MKKLLISIGSLLIMAAIVVLFVNANNSKKEIKKAKAEVEAAASCCPQPAAEATAAVDHSKCPDMKDGKCDPATCTAHKAGLVKEAEACKPAAACPATCPMKKATIK
ncbi:MAG: hypothetical protein NT092_04195 [Bacteroidia bacterium]|nr:hypothetical protein [Bacteroidia bacterium]